MNDTNQPLKMEYYGSSVLRKQAEPVTEFDDDLREFTARMVDTLYEQNGFGLAAPQVGVSKRLAVIDLSMGDEVDNILVLINPDIYFTEGECAFEEGCLSIPGIYESVVRPEKIRVRFQNLDGKPVEIEADDLLARVIQHETDHLDGILFVDRLGTVKRTMLTKTLRDISETKNGD